ncbi:MAG: DUF3500 domain-containing protein [Rhodospirillales bacterium]
MSRERDLPRGGAMAVPIEGAAQVAYFYGMMKRWFLAFTVMTATAVLSPARADDVDAVMARAAQAWLQAMGGKAADASFPFADDERFDWHYTPGSRNGVVFRDMTAAQRRAAKTLMQSTLSAPGVHKAEAVMALEAVLAEVEGSSLSYRDPEKYYISVFGAPGRYPWGWRLEGHHLSINVTVAAAGEVSVTPTFLGTNPARIPAGPRKGERVQQDEYVLALRLAAGLGADQRKQALLGDRSLGNVVAGPGRGDALKAPQGLPVASLNAEQQIVLINLITAYVGLARDDIGRPYMDLVRAGWADTRFAWAGPMAEGAAFYYRVHGPRILIEFDNSQGGGNHIHSLWRDPANDFGRDDLHRHYKNAPEAHGHRP